MTPEQAAHELDRKFRQYPWYHSIGVGDTGGDPVLFMYVRSPRHREVESLRNGWMGFDVIIRPALQRHPAGRTGSRGRGPPASQAGSGRDIRSLARRERSRPSALAAA